MTSPANVKSEPPMNRFSFYVESVTDAVPHRRRRHRHGNAVWPILLIGFAVLYFGSHMIR